MDQLILTIQQAQRRHPRMAACVVYGTIVVLFAVCIELFVPSRYTDVLYTPSPTATSSERYVLAASEPIRLVIPKLGINAAFEAPLGLLEDRTLGVPEAYNTVGWYSGSPTPGELGPSVILGHVDSYEGAAIFYHLGKLDPGDTFTIERADGSNPTFTVEKLERYPQSDFPTDQVYGPIDYAGIRLITCTGTYNYGTLRYSHNLVVYGRLVDPRYHTTSTTPAQ